MEGEEVVISGSTERTEIKVLRLHVSGLPGAIKEIDLEDRFKSFGNVLKVDLIPHPFEGKKFGVKSCTYYVHVV